MPSFGGAGGAAAAMASSYMNNPQHKMELMNKMVQQRDRATGGHSQHIGAMNHQATFTSSILPDDVNITDDVSLARFGNTESFFGANPIQTRSSIQTKR